jgi:uncharacterized phage-associated protein
MSEGDRAEPRFNFNERKATAAAALLLDREGGSMDYMRLIKLLYLAERESLKRLGHALVGDTYYALDQGPIPSRVLDLCRYPSSGPWADQIERTGLWAVRLEKPPDLGPLSNAEISVLDDVFKTFRDMDQWALSTMTHAFPEWRDPHGSRIEILPTEILAAIGKTPEQARDILEDAAHDARVDAAFGR